ncbi:MAG TPA: hypothetical protein VGO58_00105 [Chitinophagaceae bacterium]|jgi:hypothetical protein|nr:hypothetical protein [Chitinophagaceae bacterium]
MRNTFTLLALFFTVTVSAQLKKGDWNINTSTNAPMNLKLRTNGEGFKSYDFSINPGIGYFLKDRWEIGGGPVLSFEGARYKDQFSGFSFTNRSSSVGFNLYTRYYLKKEGRLIPYLTLNGGYSRTSLNSIDYNGMKSISKFNQWQVGGGAGLSWFVSPKVALFTELTYTRDWGTYMGHTGGLDLKVGIQVFFNRKKEKSK